MAPYVIVHGAWHTGRQFEASAASLRVAEKLGLFGLVQCPGSHQLCFTNPTLRGQKIIEAGRD